MDTIVHNPLEKGFGMNLRTNVVKNTFKRTSKEKHELERSNSDGLVREAP